MDATNKLLRTLLCTAALVAAGCDPDGSGRVPEVAAQTPSAAQLATSGPSGDALSAKRAEAPNDAQLSAQVEAALKAEPDLHGSTIAVRTDDGVVTLSGTTKDPQLRSMAAQVALSVGGVELVRNELELSQEA